jgi:glycosyltransferase involved in cell wall biosynthesis/CMP-N-acetylneuraminic acid synthetase
MRPKVTVYLTCHNYGRFVGQAIDSVYAQLLDDWELLIYNDGSRDNSEAVIAEKASLRPDRVHVIHNAEPLGIPACANSAIDLAKGEYLVRLDADDFFDEAALLTMATFLDRHPDVALVFPNYVYVDEDGSFLGLEHRKRVDTESAVLDLPAHGACTMVRKRVLKAVGGYSSDFTAQDGHQIWLKILHRYKVANVSTPLFSYRQHPSSLSRNQDRLLDARRKIKRHHAAKHEGEVKPSIVGIIPARNTRTELQNVCLKPVAGRPMIDYVIDAARNSELLDRLLVASDDPAVLEHCRAFPGVLTYQRPLDLSLSHTKLVEVMRDAVDHLESDLGVFPDILVTLNVHTPLVRSEDIDEAVDTLLLMNVDSVVGVYEDRDLHFTHGRNGMSPLNSGALNNLYLEREALYVDNGAMRVLWRDVLSGPSLFGRTFGHVIVPWERSFVARNPFTLDLIEHLLSNDQQEANAGT